MKYWLLAILSAIAWTGTLTHACADPYLGFVTVSGMQYGDDVGPDARVAGEVLKFSGATCVRAGGDEADYYPLLGRPGIAYAYNGMTASDIQWFNARGYYNFIFENEPDGTAGTNPNWAVDYMNRLKNTYPIIRGVSTSNQVIGGNLFTLNYGTLYDNGLQANSNMIGFHCYSNDPATGINIGIVKSVHDTMVSRGDGSKKIFLGEGWGPMRELPGLPRLFPDADITSGEIDMLRNFVVNGYWNIVTSQGTAYDPNWVWGALFFTLNDNWGSMHWAERAVPHCNGSGQIDYYIVDGYNVGLDIFPHFFNGGLIDINGNAKDNLMDVFPGKGLALSNSGFEYYDRATTDAIAADWTPKTSPAPFARYEIDASVRHGGQRSQRLTLSGSTQEYITQDSVKSSASAGLSYTLSAWVKTYQVVTGSGRAATIKLEFLNSSGSVIGTGTYATGISGTADWTRLSVTLTSPANTNRVRATCELSGASGRAWFDDVCVWQGASSATATLAGYVMDSQANVVQNATVSTVTGGYSGTTDSSGHFTIANVAPGVYDATASKSGFSSRTVKAQLALGGKTRPLGFVLPVNSSTKPTGVRVLDPAAGGVVRVIWTNPTGPFDHIHIYRSTDPSQLGTLVQDNITGSEVWDSGLSDGTKYRYTVRSVVGGVESTNTDYYYGISTGGTVSSTYSCYPGPVWGQWASDYGQTFVASKTGSISSASCTPGFGGGGGTNLTFAIYQTGPGGAQIGPSRTKYGGGDAECTVTWNAGEVPVQSGQTYYLRVTGSGGFAAYRGSDAYSQGCFYMSGAQQTGYDMWSTINIVAVQPTVITDVAAGGSNGSKMIAWTTTAPSTSQVEYGSTESYGNLTTLDSASVTQHRVPMPYLTSGEYHYRAKSTRAGIPDAASLDYTFTVSATLVASPSAAKTYSDGASVELRGVKVTAGSDRFSGRFYITDSGRVSGICVTRDPALPAITAGSVVNVMGTLTTANGERQLTDSVVQVVSGG